MNLQVSWMNAPYWEFSSIYLQEASGEAHVAPSLALSMSKRSSLILAVNGASEKRLLTVTLV